MEEPVIDASVASPVTVHVAGTALTVTSVSLQLDITCAKHQQVVKMHTLILYHFVDINECSEGHVTYHCVHGNCTNLSGGYNCSCDAGYSGDICDQLIAVPNQEDNTRKCTPLSQSSL